ncbi:MAG: hypothetical protein JWR67_1287 [Mucilaginibacter sp.]|nr:hypothetical protein [Mucilaginibacter sp.]
MCNFNITFTETVADFVTKIKTRIEGANGSFQGDETSGEFSVPTPIGKIEGNYSITGQDAAITITRKPILISCHAIEEYTNKSL